jgi:hypothetical protein
MNFVGLGLLSVAFDATSALLFGLQCLSFSRSATCPKTVSAVL